MNEESEQRASDLRSGVLAALSITEAMGRWCAERGIGRLPLQSRVHLRADTAALPADAPLRLQPGEPVFFRRITLMSGEVPLLEADNWFLPTRLPDRTVQLLLATDTPFGTALVGGLQGRKTTQIFVPPGIGDLGVGAVEKTDVPLLTLRGVVHLDSRAVSFVEERFRMEALG